MFRSKNSDRLSLPFGLDYGEVLSGEFGTDQPEYALPIDGSLTEYERSASKQSISLVKLMFDGPFYTGSSSGTKLAESETAASDGIHRHSDKYKKVKKVGRTIEEYPYNLEFFPEELYSVMGVNNKNKKKLLSMSIYKSDGGLKQFQVNEGNDDSEAKNMLEKLKNMAEDLDSKNDQNAKEEEEVEEDIDDEFDEEDDDDYNAEKYFDDGDEDMPDDDADEAAF